MDGSDNKIIGRNPVLEAIRSGVNIEKIMIKKGKQEGSIIPVIRKAKDAGIFVQEVDKNKLDAVSNGENHQGIIAFVCEYEYSEGKCECPVRTACFFDSCAEIRRLRTGAVACGPDIV